MRAGCQQLIPEFERFLKWTSNRKLWEKSIVDRRQLMRNARLELRHVVPDLQARITVHIPIHPWNAGFVHELERIIEGMGDKRQAAVFACGVDEHLGLRRALAQFGLSPVDQQMILLRLAAV